MNREELKKEAQEQVNYCTPLYPESFIQGYLAGAEPRENKIADIKANCDLAIEGRDIKIKELEKENAELNNFIMQSKKDGISPINALIIKNLGNQLTKAKDHIKTLLDCLKQDTNDPQTNYYVCQYMDKAEQFLKEIEK